MSSFDIVKTLLRTEKGTLMESDRKYIFKVASCANKIQIRKAVEEIYNIKVQSVHTMIVPSKPKTVRRELGWTSPWKKAIVTLREGQKIEVK